MFNAGVDTDLGNLQKIGSITALIAEAADASATGATVEDGKSGDTVWRCRKRGKKCRASIRTRGQFILEQLKEHNHNPDHLILVQNINPLIPSIL